MDLRTGTSAAIAAIYDTVIDPEAWPEALCAVRSLLGGAGSVAFVLAEDGRSIPFFAVDNLNTDSHSEYEQHIRRIDPRIQPSLADPPGVPMWDYRLMDDAAMDRHEFYDAIERLSGVRYFVGMRPVVADGASLLIAMQRTRRQGHFTPDEIALFASIAPHFGHARRLAEAGARAGQEATLLHLLEERHGDGVILLDATGRLMEANAEAARILALGDGLRLNEGALEAWKAADTRSLRAAFQSALASSAGETPAGGGVIALPRPSGALPFLLRIMPWPPGQADPARRPAAVILLRDPQRRVTIRQAELSALLGLTEREAALALRLASGESLQVAAAALGIRYNTARAHLRAIFAKTGTAGQHDLQRLILAAP